MDLDEPFGSSSSWQELPAVQLPRSTSSYQTDGLSDELSITITSLMNLKVVRPTLLYTIVEARRASRGAVTCAAHVATPTCQSTGNLQFGTVLYYCTNNSVLSCTVLVTQLLAQFRTESTKSWKHCTGRKRQGTQRCNDFLTSYFENS